MSFVPLSVLGRQLVTPEFAGPGVGGAEPEEPLDWQELALCPQTDPEMFFPEKGGSVVEAKRICAACPVRAECLDYAFRHDERFGVWGGLSERERRRLRRAAGSAGQEHAEAS